jgi:putative ABC transport system permease protein
MRLLSYLRDFFSNRGGLDGELDEELRSHIARHADDLERSGLSRAEAERRARIAFGSTEKTKEAVRETRPGAFLDTLGKDIRFAVRMLQKNPGFTTVAVFTLALGIGANTAIFSVIDTVLLRPLPYSDPSSLVWAGERFPVVHGAADVISPDFLAWQQHNQVFDQIEAFAGSSGANLTAAGEPARVDVTDVTPGLFSMLGVKPLIGRTFLPDEGRLATNHVALISESLWRSRFGADPQISGKTIRLDDALFTIAGVIPGTLRYPGGDVWTPLALDDDVFTPQSPHWRALIVVGRLKRGMDPTQAQSDLQIITGRIHKEFPPEAAGFLANSRVEVAPLHTLLVQNVRSLLWILLAAVAFILLIACANVANLLLAHGVIRSREMAVRAALGASRWRLIRQMFTEAFLLALAGGALGLLIGLWSTKELQQLIPSDLPSEIHLDPRILSFCCLVTVIVVLAFGLLPALIASRPYVNEALKAGTAQHSATPAARRLRALLCAAEIALSLILLIGAGLLARSFLRISEVALGFEPHNLLLATVQRPVGADHHSQQYAGFFQDALQRMKALPGVTDAALTTNIPLRIPNGAGGIVTVQGAPSVHVQPSIFFSSISPGYFRTMNIRLLQGRDFRDGDTADAPGTVIINSTLAQIVFGKRDPIGQRVSFGPPPETWSEIIGVVSDKIGSSLEQAPVPEVFNPYLQEPSFSMTLALRTHDHPESLGASVRAVVEEIDKNQPVSELTTMDDIIAKTVAPRRFKMQLLGLFAMLALVLAGVGIYGLMSYNVQQRTHEIGVRNALGASREDILGLIIAQGFRLTVFGVLAGIAGALALTRYMASLLFGVNERDPFTFAAVVFVLSAVALVACYIPARRAATVDPMVALRHE